MSTSCNFFSGSSSGRNSEVKRAWPGALQGWVTDRELVPGCARVRTKCAEKTSVDLWGQSRDPRELPGVTAAGPGWVGVLQFGIRADPCGNSGVCGSCGWTCGTCAGTGRTDGSKGGSSWTGGLTDEGVGLLRGEGCDILA